MALAVLFLLLGLWAAELALFGVAVAPLVGAGCLLASALVLTVAALQTPQLSEKFGRSTPQKAGASARFAEQSATFGS